MDNILLKYNSLDPEAKKQVQHYIDMMIARKKPKKAQSEYKKRILSIPIWSEEDVKPIKDSPIQLIQAGGMVVDTSLFIEFLRAKEKENTRLYNLPDSLSYNLSAVTLFELYMGATSLEKEKSVQLLTNGLNILPFTDEIALLSGKIYQALKRKNQMIEFRDIFIAATCVVHVLPLATLNKKHFERIDDLVLFDTAN